MNLRKTKLSLQNINTKNRQKLESMALLPIKHRTPPKFTIAPGKWWLEYSFPIGKGTSQGLWGGGICTKKHQRKEPHEKPCHASHTQTSANLSNQNGQLRLGSRLSKHYCSIVRLQGS